jgi:hypothetical protein
MIIRKSGSRVLWYECIGFGSILALCWINELGNLPKWLLGDRTHTADWREGALLSALILIVWWLVLTMTRKLLAHLHYLEGLLRVCAWCRKVGHNGEWMRLEEYFSRGFQIETTHGMCPDCQKKMEEDTAEFHRQRGNEDSRELVPPTEIPTPTPATAK